MKKNFACLGIFGVLVGKVISRVAIAKYGENVRATIMFAALAVSIFALLGIVVYTKKYIAAIAAVSMLLPLAFMTIGVYLSNLYLGAFGFGLIFILIPIMKRIIQNEE